MNLRDTLLAVSNDATVISEDQQLSMFDSYGYVSSVQFINQGTNSTVNIQIGSAIIELAPGPGKSGASFEVSMPQYGYDTTNYKVWFRNAGGVGTQVNRLVVCFQKYQQQK